MNVSTQYQTQVGETDLQPKVVKVAVRRIFKDALSCAHFLPHHNGKCSRPHGHNYTIEVELTGEVHTVMPGSSVSGMVEDFGTIDKDFALLIEQYDHTVLNDSIDYPTAEALAVHFLAVLSGRDARYTQVIVWETSDSCAIASI